MISRILPGRSCVADEVHLQGKAYDVYYRHVCGADRSVCRDGWLGEVLRERYHEAAGCAVGSRRCAKKSISGAIPISAGSTAFELGDHCHAGATYSRRAYRAVSDLSLLCSHQPRQVLI